MDVLVIEMMDGVTVGGSVVEELGQSSRNEASSKYEQFTT